MKGLTKQETTPAPAADTKPAVAVMAMGARHSDVAPAVHSDRPRTNVLRSVSPFVTATILFLLLNGALSFINPVKFDRYAFPYRNWTWWQVNDLRTSTCSYNAALLGSSLVISAINCCDADYLNKKLDQIKYHGAAYLDYKLKQKFGGRFHTFNLAAPGQTPADAYLCLRTMVDCGKKPDVAIYAIAPRDFIDSTMQNAADSEPFRYLSRILNYADIDPQAAYHRPADKLGYFLQRRFYLSGNAADLQMLCESASRAMLDKLVPQPLRGEPFTWWDRVKFLPQYKIGDVYPALFMVEPTCSTAEHKFLDNTKDYQVRYRSPRKWAYEAQVHYLQKLAKYCRKEHIYLCIVNMPITNYNVSMLPPEVYKFYIDSLAQVAAADDAEFFNLCNFKHYPLSLYNDYVHLNGTGGKVLVDDLVNHLAASPPAAQALKVVGSVQKVSGNVHYSNLSSTKRKSS